MKKYAGVILFFAGIAIYLALVNLGFKCEYTGGDAGAVYVFPLHAMHQSLYAWYEMCYGGIDGVINLPRLFPFLTFVSALNYAGITTLVIQRILFAVYIFIPSLSMFCLLSYLIKEDFRGRLIVLSLGSIFYAVNHYTMIILSHPVGIGELFAFYLVLPLLFLVFAKGLHGGNYPSPSSSPLLGERKYLFPLSLWERVGVRGYAVLFGFLFMFVLPGNLAYGGLVVFILGFYFLYCLAAQRNYAEMLKFVLFAGMFSFLFSFWFIIPYGDFVLRNRASVMSNFMLGDVAYVKILNTRNILKNVVVLCGEVWDNAQDIASLKPMHENLLYIKLKYIIPLMSFGAILWIRRKREILFFILLASLSVFLAKGINPPAGNVFVWMYQSVQGFGIYRNAYDKFCMPLAFSYAVLISISLSYLIKCISNRLVRVFVYGVVGVSIVVSSMLFWQGKVLRWPNFLVKIPASYNEVEAYLGSDKEDSKVLTFPITSRRMKKLNWGYMGVDIFELLLNKPVINYFDLWQRSAGIRNWVLKKDCFASVSKIFNTRYILLDTNQENLVERQDKYNLPKVYSMYKTIFEQRLKDIMSPILPSFDNLLLYKIGDNCYLPHIYAAKYPVVIFGNLSVLEVICYEKYLGKNPLLVFSNQNKKMTGNEEAIKNAKIFVSMKKRMYESVLKNTKSKIAHFIPGFYKQKDFYIDKSGKYLLKYLLLPKVTYKRGDKYTFVGFSCVGNNIDLAKHNSEGEYSIDGNGNLIIDTYFDGAGSEDEYFQMKVGNLDIDIKKYPWFVLEYKVEDPCVQYVEAVVGVDVNSDGTVEEYVRGMTCRAYSTNYQRYFNSIYFKLTPKYSGCKNVVIKEVELYPHKYTGVDCSGSRKKNYRFWVKGFEFSNGYRAQGVLEIEDSDKSPLNPPFAKGGVGGFKCVRAGSFDIDKTVAKIDGGKIQLKQTIKGIKHMRNGIEFSEEIYLEKGEHNFLNLIMDWRTFQPEWFFIEPALEYALKEGESYMPEAKYIKINPTRYIAEVSTKGPCWLVFSEGFNNSWEAYAYDLGSNGNKVKLNNHYTVNGYANGWYISEKDLFVITAGKKPEDYKIEVIINYKPQCLLRISMLISGVSVLFGLIILIRTRKG